MKRISQSKLTDTYSQTKLISKSPVSEKAVKRKANVDENNCVKALSFETEFEAAKKALHTSRPTDLVGRESQILTVYEFLEKCLSQKIAGSMYISGAPGTGKTAVVGHVIAKLSLPNDDDGDYKNYNFSHVNINCMGVRSPASIYEMIVSQSQLKTKVHGSTHKDVLYNRIMSKSGKMIVLVLDEMDQLLKGRSHEIIYSLFEWARTIESKLIIIGIANALDLTVRQLPLLLSSPTAIVAKSRRSTATASKKIQVKKSPEPTKLMQFPPYERTEIEKILETRMRELDSEIFDPTAIKFVAAKVAASTGDMRKALNACKMALDAAEREGRHACALKVTSDDGFNSSSPKKMRGEKVGVAALSKVMSVQKDEGPLPLQQMIILCTLLRVHKSAPHARQSFDGVSTPVPITLLYDEYRKVCSEKGFSWIDRSEILSVCSMLQDRSHVTVIEGGPSSGTFKKSSMKKQAGVLFDPKLAEILLKSTDLKTLTD